MDWLPFPTTGDTLIGYYVYRTCDDQDPVCINDTILPATASGFVDSSTLKPGKIYTYYVAACYNDGITQYLTMNSMSSTVVWGIPQLSEAPPQETVEISTDDRSQHVGSIFGDGSFAVVVSMVALVVAVAAVGAVAASKKNKTPAESEDEE